MSLAYEPIMGRNTGLSMPTGITCVAIAAGCSAAVIGRPSAGIGRAISGEMNVGSAGGESWESVADTRARIRDVRFTLKSGHRWTAETDPASTAPCPLCLNQCRRAHVQALSRLIVPLHQLCESSVKDGTLRILEQASEMSALPPKADSRQHIELLWAIRRHRIQTGPKRSRKLGIESTTSFASAGLALSLR